MMNRFDPPRPSSMSQDRLRLIDERCDQYEADWRALLAPRIEDYLDGTQGEVRCALSLELTILDQSLRHSRCETIALADYAAHHPGLKHILDLSTGGLTPVITVHPDSARASLILT